LACVRLATGARPQVPDQPGRVELGQLAVELGRDRLPGPDTFARWDGRSHRAFSVGSDAGINYRLVPAYSLSRSGVFRSTIAAAPAVAGKTPKSGWPRSTRE